jgi:hypothetical protein
MKLEVGYRNKNKDGEWFEVISSEKGYDIRFDTGEIRTCFHKNLIVAGRVNKIEKKIIRFNAEIGQRFGKLVVVGLEDPIHPLLLCDCGNTCTTARANLFRDKKTSCGCIPTISKYNKFWESFDKWMEDWDSSSGVDGVSRLPLFEFKKGSTDITGVGGFTLVDDEFFDYWKNYPFQSGKLGRPKLCSSRYVYTKLTGNAIRGDMGSRKAYLLHHLVFGCTNFSNYVIDHIDGNVLNNTRANLRLATAQENGFNAAKTKSKTTSKYKGVVYIASAYSPKKTRYKPWRAIIRVGDKSFVNHFETEKQAAQAYNELALLYHGEFARLNIIEDE